ncbi:MAG: adenylate/guanylate cyclase domain-containing protein [Gemmobacter sp.]
MDAALDDVDITGLFNDLCHRLRGVGIPLERAVLNWPALHPLFRAELIEWSAAKGPNLLQFAAGTENGEAWRQSPFYYAHSKGLSFLRRRLTGPETLLDFPILPELRDQGCTDYLITSSSFRIARVDHFEQGRIGIMGSWSTKRESGFSEADIAALIRIQRAFGVACRATLQVRVMGNVAEAFLGPTGAQRVLSGDIRLGDGAEINAVVWYSDLRGSTRMSARMKPDAYLDVLRRFYGCTARAVIDEGGEVLAFIGDAVLGIFPVRGDIGFPEAARGAIRAMEKALDLGDAEEAARPPGAPEIRFSVILASGPVKFGNVGVAERLVFTAIGEVVNAVTRIDDLTKTLGRSVLVTDEVAAIDPDRFVPLGAQSLPELDRTVRLHARLCKRDAFDHDLLTANIARSLAG